MNIFAHTSLYININFKWVLEQNKKPNTIKVLEESIKYNLGDLRLYKRFYRYGIKTPEP